MVQGRGHGQEYNQRKGRKGAFWEDSYHAAVQNHECLARCIVYIDLNMVRAGVVTHPEQWAESGYREAQIPPKRYRVINVQALMQLQGFKELAQYQRACATWVDAALVGRPEGPDGVWTESLAMGSEHFVEGIK